MFIENMTEDFDMIWVNSPKSQCDLPATLFFTGKDAPTGGAFADFGTRTENKTSQDVFCEPNVRIKLRRIVGVNLQRS